MRHPSSSVARGRGRAAGAHDRADELEEAGFQMLEATNADEALKVLEARFDEVQVLFTMWTCWIDGRHPG
jgi:hypothetical protein